MNNPKIIFIDWHKTLSNSFFWSGNLKYSDVFFKHNRELINPWMRGEYTAEEVCKILSDQNNFDFDDVLKSLRESCGRMTFVSDKIPELIKNIRSKGIKVIVATDNMDTFSRFTIPELDLKNIFDDFLLSYDLKVLKNDVGENSIPFFDDYLNKNSLDYRDCVLLDDSGSSSVYDSLGFKSVMIGNGDELLDVLENILKIN
ncbi:MAG: hypothetical protein WCV92_00330 [Candidatus Buchananbacteria bacterium]|jgi:FMN phosphatase YigB (HAD superfamily)